jgi:hypothetical protein
MGPLAKKPVPAPRRFNRGRTRILWLGLAALIVAVIFLISPAILRRSAAKEQVRLPMAVLGAIREIFPKAVISEVGMEDDEGMTLFVVETRVGETYVEVVASPDGVIAEVSIEITAADVPQAAMAAIRKAAEGAQVTEIDTVGAHAEVKDGRLVKLQVPRTTYWAEFEKGGLAGEVTVAPDGTVVEMSADLEAKDVPEAVLAAIRKTADGASITELGRDEIHAELEGGKTVRLQQAEVYYWAEFQKDDTAGEVSVAPDGAVVEVLKWKCVTENRDEGSCKDHRIRLNRGRSPCPAPQSA